MNLENLNLVELNAQEVKDFDGGTYHCSACGAVALAQNAYGHGVNMLQIGLGFLAGMGDGIRDGMK
jgi:hypothetical protein